MNDRNVEALAEAVEAALIATRCPDESSAYLRERAAQMASVLAARGVLVPSALTDEDMDGLPWDAREQLERIARGEADRAD